MQNAPIGQQAVRPAVPATKELQGNRDKRVVAVAGI